MNTSTSKHILRKLVAFSIPLILSGLLQQLFNWVDALIVGNIIGEAALAGIGTTSSLYNLFVTVLVGFTSGLTVLFAQQYGKGEESENKYLLTGYTVILCIIFTVIAAVGMIFISTLLGLLDTPENLLEYARQYLFVIFMGIPFLAVYNTYSAALRGMGNSKTPFAAVLISSATNGILDFVFIAICGFGVWSAAAATVISQVAMTIFIVVFTHIRYPQLRFSLNEWGRCIGAIKSGGTYAVPPAVQSSVTSVGNIFLQRFMNGFGEQTVAAITTSYRVDTVLLLPIFNLTTAISTIVAQETGAGNHREAKKALKIGTVLMAIMSLGLTAVIIVFGKSVLSIFGLTSGAVTIGSEFFKRIAMFYVIFGVANSIKGYLEGTSDMLFSGVIGICSLGVRLIGSYALADVFGNMVIAYAEAIAWVFLLIACFARYKMRGRTK